MRLLLGLLVLVALVAGLLLFPLRGGPPADVGAAPLTAPGLGAAAGSGPSDGAVREVETRAPVADTQSGPLDSSASDEPALETEPGVESAVAVRGWVRWDDDGSTLGGFDFRLRGPGGVVAITTDATGYFETDVVVQPGVLMALHRRSPGEGQYPEWLEFATDSIPVYGAAGESVELDLLVRRPQARLVVRVVHRDGSPAPAASVELALAREVRPDDIRHQGREVVADELGVARFALFDLEQVVSLELIARQAAARTVSGREPLVSAPTQLELPLGEAPLRAPITLVLDAGARLLIRVVTETGVAMPGRRVLVVSPNSDVGVELGELPFTDEDGRVEVAGVPPGEVALWILDTPAESATRLEVLAGETREVELVLAGGGPRLAVAGRVVDEVGAPLSGIDLLVEFGPRAAAGTTRASTRSGADGTFELEAEPSEGLTIRSDHSLWGDEFDPTSLDLPFGTRDVMFRRTRTYPREEIAFEVVDAATGERCAGVLVMTFLAPRRATYAFHRAGEGLASPRCSTHPNTTLVVTAPGYRRTTLELAELLRQEPRDGLRRVSLQRGLLRRLHVEGADATGEASPVRGARVLDGARVVGTADASGDVEVDLGLAPRDGLTIEADGFRSTRWKQVDDLAELEPAWIWLERAD